MERHETKKQRPLSVNAQLQDPELLRAYTQYKKDLGIHQDAEATRSLLNLGLRALGYLPPAENPRLQPQQVAIAA